MWAFGLVQHTATAPGAVREPTQRLVEGPLEPHVVFRTRSMRLHGRLDLWAPGRPADAALERWRPEFVTRPRWIVGVVAVALLVGGLVGFAGGWAPRDPDSGDESSSGNEARVATRPGVESTPASTAKSSTGPNERSIVAFSCAAGSDCWVSFTVGEQWYGALCDQPIKANGVSAVVLATDTTGKEMRSLREVSESSLVAIAGYCSALASEWYAAVPADSAVELVRVATSTTYLELLAN